jgi:hypothetical protein
MSRPSQTPRQGVASPKLTEGRNAGRLQVTIESHAEGCCDPVASGVSFRQAVDGLAQAGPPPGHCGYARMESLPRCIPEGERHIPGRAIERRCLLDESLKLRSNRSPETLSNRP